MPKAAHIQYAFNGGQLGPRMQGRADLARYATGCNKMQNFIPTYQGPALKRSGTRHVKEVKDSTKATRLMAFEFSRSEAYVLELGEGYMRVMRDSAAVVETTFVMSADPTATNPVVIEKTAHPYANGDEVFIEGSLMLELNGRYFTIANVTANTFELVGEDGTGRTTGFGGAVSRTYEIADGVASNSLPWTEDQLFGIKVVQSADVLYLAHPDVAPHKIERTSDTDWTCTEIVFSDPPFREENKDESITMYASAETGTAITLTASAAVFEASMVGSYVRIAEVIEEKNLKWSAQRAITNWNVGNLAVGDRCYYEGNVYEATNLNGATSSGSDAPVHEDGIELDKKYSWEFINHGYGYGKITAFTSSTVVTVDVDTDGTRFPESVVLVANATDKWSLSAFSETNGYPRAVAFFEDRLWWAGTTKDPQTIWGSETGEYENHRTIGSRADTAIQITIASDKINAIEWMSGEDVLLVGTLGGEFTADGGSTEEAITPSNIRVRRRSNYGTAVNVSPVFVDSATLMVSRAKNRIYELSYSFQSDRYVAPDLTEMSHDILGTGVVEMAYQSSPFRLLWAALADGDLASLTYVPDQEVLGWAKYKVGGTTATAESIAAIPHPTGDQDQLWILSKRTVGGSEVRHIDFLERPFEFGDDREDAFFVDAGLSYDGAAATTIYGLNHLAGETVSILADGVLLADQAVSSSGTLTLATAASKVHAGLPMPYAQLQIMRIEGGAADGTSMGRKGRIPQLVMRLTETGEGLYFGTDFAEMTEWEKPTTPDLYTGDTESEEMPGGYEQPRRVALEHRSPLPCTVDALMPIVVSEPR